VRTATRWSSSMALHDISVATGGLVLEVQGDEEKE
jgi:hypothetical protein